MAKVDLLGRFVASFPKLGDMTVTSREEDPIGWELRTGDPDDFGWFEWRPAGTTTNPVFLDLLYAELPARFPPLYEQLILSYRWAQVDLGIIRLLPNPPGPDLSGLLGQITGDKELFEGLISAGYIQFGRGTDVDYDPVCFDIKSRTKENDYKIVKIDHEEILCNHRVKVVAEITPSFGHLVQRTIERANSAR